MPFSLFVLSTVEFFAFVMPDLIRHSVQSDNPPQPTTGGEP